MESIFVQNSDEKLLGSEHVVRNWMETHRSAIDDMIPKLQSFRYVILVTKNTIHTHKNQLGQLFPTISTNLHRVERYSFNVQCYFMFDTCNGFAPFINLKDFDLESEPDDLVSLNDDEMDFFKNWITSFSDTCWIVFQTDDNEEGITNIEDNIFMATFPSSAEFDGDGMVLDLKNYIDDVALVILFGELRYSGVLCHLWNPLWISPWLSSEIFYYLLEETVITPFYLNPSMSKHETPVIMGMAYILQHSIDTSIEIVVPDKHGSKMTVKAPSPPRKPKRKASKVQNWKEQQCSIAEKEPEPVEEPAESSGEDLIFQPEDIEEPAETIEPQKQKGEYVINPKNGKKVKKGSKNYMNLMKKGIIKEMEVQC